MTKTTPLGPNRPKTSILSSPVNLMNESDKRYRIVTKFDSGGHGELYTAIDNNCRRLVAIKAIKGKNKCKEAIFRFIVEGQLTAQLEHPNIVPVHDLSVDSDNSLFYVMKQIKGITLLRILLQLTDCTEKYVKDYPLSRLLTIFQDICNAVAYAHSKGVIHRDLKPENIMVGDYGEVLVLDWGIAKILDSSPLRQASDSYQTILKQVGIENYGLDDIPEMINDLADNPEPGIEDTNSSPDSGEFDTYAGRVMGTMGYMSPEQAEGEVDKVDCRSDVFSLGILLYYLLALRLPFSGSKPHEIYQKISRGNVIAPIDLAKPKKNDINFVSPPAPMHCPGNRIPASLSAVAMKAISMNPDDRYQSVTDLQDDIRNYQLGFATSAEDAGAMKLLLLFFKRNRVLSAGIFIIGLLTFIFVIQLVKSERMALTQKHLAEKHAAISQVESTKAKQRLADSLIAEGNALGTLDNWQGAKQKYQEAVDVLTRIDQSIFRAQLGLWNAYKHAPPAMNSLTGHTSPVLSLAISPDNSFCVSGAATGSLIIWELKTGQILQKSNRTHSQSPIVQIAISPNNQDILCGRYDGKIELWNIKKNALTLTLNGGHTRWINNLVFSPDNRLSASVSAEGVVILWDLNSGKKLHELKEHNGAVTSVAFSNSGQWLLTGGIDNTVRLWDVVRGQLEKTYDKNLNSISVVLFDAAEENIVCGNLAGKVKLIDRASGEIHKEFRGHNSSILKIRRLQKDGVIIIAQKDMTFTLWDTANDTVLHQIKGPNQLSSQLAFSTDGKLAVTNGQGNTLDILSLSGANEIKSFYEHRGTITATAFSPNDQLIVTGSNDKSINLWDAATGKKLKTLAGHGRGVTMVNFLNNYKNVISTSLDGTIRFWDLFSGKSDLIDGKYGPIISAAMSNSGNFLLIGYRNGNVVLWDIKERQEKRKVISVNKSIRGLSFSTDDSTAIMVKSNGSLVVWDVPGFEIRRQMKREGLHSANLSPDGQLVICGFRTGHLKLFGSDNGKELVRFNPAQSSVVTHVQFSPSGHYIYSTSRSGNLSVWETHSGKQISEFSEHERGITSIDVGAVGNQIITGGRDKVVKLWNFDTPLDYKSFQYKNRENFSKLNVAHKNSKILISVGEWYAYRGFSKWAVDFFDEAQKMGADNVGLQLARCYWKKRNDTLAIFNFNQVLRSNNISNDYINLCINAITVVEE